LAEPEFPLIWPDTLDEYNRTDPDTFDD